MMKKIIHLFLLFLSVNSFSQQITKPYSIINWAMPVDSVNYNLLFEEAGFSVVVYPESRIFGEIKQFEKLELGIKMNEEITEAVNIFLRNGTRKPNINPFDPEDISVEVEFSGGGDGKNTKRKVFGFYYKEYQRDMINLTWNEDTTTFPWRIRFAPEQIGIYHFTIKIKALGKEWKSIPVFFRCTGSDKKGFIEVKEKGTLNGRYLSFSKTGETFFPIGLNLDWPAAITNESNKVLIEYYHQKNKIPLSKNIIQTESHQSLQYNLWVKQLQLNGGNSFAVGMAPFGFSIEWEKLNDYSKGMNNAWELDRLVEMAESQKMFIALSLDFHDEFLSDKKLSWNHSRIGWDDNPYNSKNHTKDSTIKTQLDFFKNKTAITNYKKKDPIYHCTLGIFYINSLLGNINGNRQCVI